MLGLQFFKQFSHSIYQFNHLSVLPKESICLKEFRHMKCGRSNSNFTFLSLLLFFTVHSHIYSSNDFLTHENNFNLAFRSFYGRGSRLLLQGYSFPDGDILDKFLSSMFVVQSFFSGKMTQDVVGNCTELFYIWRKWFIILWKQGSQIVKAYAPSRHWKYLRHPNSWLRNSETLGCYEKTRCCVAPASNMNSWIFCRSNGNYAF